MRKKEIMGSRSVAKVVISLGMTAVAVKLYLSAKSEGIEFNMLNPKTGNRVRQKLVDGVTGEEIKRDETVKGYEYVKDSYVTFTDEEIANMQAAKRDTIDVTEFVSVSEIDPLHIEKTFYTGPDRGMDKGYHLLYETLRRENKAAIGTWISRGKEHLVTICAYQHGLVMHQMFYNTEVRAFDNTCASVQLSPVELAMSKLLVDQFTVPVFDGSKYSDKFMEKLNAAVNVKLSGGSITATAAKGISTNVAESLRASLLSIGVPEAKIDAMVAKALAESAPAAVLPVEEPKVKRVRSKKSVG